MKNVLFVINTLGTGGAERAMFALMKRLKDPDVKISLYVLTNQGELFDEVPSHVHIINKDPDKTSVLTLKGRIRLVSRLFKQIVSDRNTDSRKGSFYISYFFDNLFEMIKNGHIWPEKLLWRLYANTAPAPSDKVVYDTAIAFIEGGSSYYIANRIKAKRKAAFIHVDYKKAGYSRQLDNGDMAVFDNIYAVSEDVKNSFLEVYPELSEKTVVFGGFTDAGDIKRRAARASGDNIYDSIDGTYNGVRVLSVGRLTYQKGYDTAIKAMKILKNEGACLKWYVLGEGDLETRLKKLVKRYGLQNDFVFLGVKKDALSYIRDCDIFVNSSRFEGRSLAVAESLVLGKAVILSNVSGNRDIIKNGHSGLYFDGTPKELAKAVYKLIKDPEKRKYYGKNAALIFDSNDDGLQENIYLF